MSKRLGNLKIIDDMYNYLKIEDRGITGITLGDVLSPVIDVQNFSRELYSQTQTDTATDVDHPYTVPAGEIWTIKYISMYRAQTGTLKIFIKPVLTGALSQIEEVTGGTTAWLNDLNSVQMREGDIIQCSFGAGTSGSMTSIIVYERQFTA